MLKFPFKTEILLITNSGEFIGTVIHGGTDILKVENVSRRTYSQAGLPINTYVSDLMMFDRNQVIGYSKLEHVNAKPKFKVMNGCSNVFKIHGD